MNAARRIQVHARTFGFRTKVLDANWGSMREIRMLVKDRMTSSGQTQTALAEQADVSQQTLSKLVKGVTRYPRWKTVVGVLGALGLEVTCVNPQR